MAHLPDDAFARYVAMGVARTYEGLAKLLGVSKRTVVRRALAEKWQERLLRVEEEAQRKTMERAVEDVVAIDEKHLRMARAIQARALETLKSAPLGNGTAAVRALDVAIKIERAILGRGKETPAAANHAALAAAAAAIPKEAVDAAREVMRKLEAEKKAAASAPAPPEPVVPPALAPRVYGEN